MMRGVSDDRKPRVPRAPLGPIRISVHVTGVEETNNNSILFLCSERGDP